MTRQKTESAPGGPALELIAARFRVLGEPNRLRLILALEAGERSVTELVAATGLSQANVSRHLHALAEGGILARRKAGLRVIYSIADKGIFDLCDHVCGSLMQRLEHHARAFDAPPAFRGNGGFGSLTARRKKAGPM